MCSKIGVKRNMQKFLEFELQNWGISMDDIYNNDEVITFLYNPDGSIKKFN